MWSLICDSINVIHFPQNSLMDSFSSSSSSLTFVSTPSSLSHNWIHDVFPSFRGEDVRGGVFSHIQKGFERQGIRQFNDQEIERGEFISSELIKAIRGSKISLVLISRNYASSSWCLDELVEIMKCRKEFGQIVIAIFYKVNPSDVRNETGDFGKVLRETCAGQTKEKIKRWKLALAEVAIIGGYDSNTWDNEAAMIEYMTTDVSRKLNPPKSINFDEFLGMRDCMGKLSQFLGLDVDEVRMIGIWGRSGTGKTTITKFRREKKDIDSSLLTPTSPSYALSRNCIHDVFPSFRGEDVRRDIFSHIQKGFERIGIRQFNDQEIERRESISSELINAIKGSKIAVVLISRNYASSSRCLDELVEIMKRRKEFGQIVIAIFYKVDPSDVRKETGDFGKVFKKTCAGQTKEKIERWRLALAEVTLLAGYDSSSRIWKDEAAMVENIVTNVSKKLTPFTKIN